MAMLGGTDQCGFRDEFNATRGACFITGSKYRGTWDSIGIAGSGKYVMPHKVTYEGEFFDGEFHGRGTMRWPRGQRIEGVWKHGRLQEWQCFFRDKLAFREKDWKYCQYPDRRFYESINKGLRPARRTLATNRRPTVLVPPDCYDVGFGIFEPNSYSITSYNDPHKVLEIPTKSRAKDIEETCRKGWTEPTGYRPGLHEEWTTVGIYDTEPSILPRSCDSPAPWWKRVMTFTRDPAVKCEYEESIRIKKDKERMGKPTPRPCKRESAYDLWKSGSSCICYLYKTPV